MTSRQLFLGSGVIAGFRIFTIIGTLREKESREHTLKYFIPNYILIFMLTLANILRTKNEYFSKKILEKHQNIL